MNKEKFNIINFKLSTPPVLTSTFCENELISYFSSVLSHHSSSRTNRRNNARQNFETSGTSCVRSDTYRDRKLVTEAGTTNVIRGGARPGTSQTSNRTVNLIPRCSISPRPAPASKINQSCGAQRSSRQRSLIQPSVPTRQGH